MFNLVVILARGNSKRLPGKNIKLLDGKPLIGYAIKAARDVADVSDVIVSTDCSEIAKVAEIQGARVPFMRPAELASDESTSDEALIHAVDTYESISGNRVDNVVLVQPTSPFTTPEMIQQCLDKVSKEGFLSALTVSIPAKRAEWYGEVDDQGQFQKFVEGSILAKLQKAKQYCPTGNVYVGKRENLVTEHLLDKNSLAAVAIEQGEAIDIDYELDFLFAEFLLKRKGYSNVK